MQPLYAYHNHATAPHAATFLFVLLFVLVQVVRSRQDGFEIIDMDPLVPVVKPKKGSPTTLTLDAERYLRAVAEKHGLTQDISLLSQRVRSVEKAPKRLSMTNIERAFTDSKFQSIRWDDEDQVLGINEETSLTITKSPAPGTIDASDLLFGISTTYNRLTYANNCLIRDWQRWLTDGYGSSNGAGVVIGLHNSTIKEAWETHDKLRESGIDAIVLSLDDGLDPISRYLEMVDILLEVNQALADDETPKKYLGVVDDDIFFPTPGLLLTKLSKFDASSPYYIGIPSERPDWSVENETAVTHGGGAIFLTPPAASIISELPCYDPKGPPIANLTHWDSVLHGCVTSHTDMPLHILSSFYSPTDALYNMQAPTYDLGVSPLTLHHYKSRHLFDPSRAHLVTSVCGEACFLQRFRFADNWVLVNGYSLTHYCAGFEVVPMTSDADLQGAMQYGQEAELPLGKGIVLDKTAEKSVVTWRGVRNVWSFSDAVVGDNGEVWQVYVKKGGGSRLVSCEGEAEEDMVDSVIILVWES